MLMASRPDRSVLEGSATILLGSCRVSGLSLLPLLPCHARSKEGRVEREWGEDYFQWGGRREGGCSLQGDSLGIAGERSVGPVWSKEGGEHQCEHPRCQPFPQASCSNQEGTRHPPTMGARQGSKALTHSPHPGAESYGLCCRLSTGRGRAAGWRGRNLPSHRHSSLSARRGRNSGFKSPERKGVKMKNPVKKGLSGQGEVLPSLSHLLLFVEGVRCCCH